MRGIIFVASVLLLSACSDASTENDRVDVAVANGRQALAETSALRDRNLELESQIEELESRLSDLEAQAE